MGRVAGWTVTSSMRPSPTTRPRRPSCRDSRYSLPVLTQSSSCHSRSLVPAHILSQDRDLHMTAPAPDAPPVSPTQQWAITFTIMVAAVIQILNTSVTNFTLPHLQGSLSAGLDEVSWVITSYLAANAVVIPATGWPPRLFRRQKFFLICCTLFTVSSFISGAAPDLATLIVARIFQG